MPVLEGLRADKEYAEAKEEYEQKYRALDESSKPTNPKDMIGANKIPLHLVSSASVAMEALGHLDGMLKYGRDNYRAIGIRASIYFDAAVRHLSFWFEGEDIDPDSGLPHLAHAKACLGIIVDAIAAGKFNDDRKIQGGYRGFMNEMTSHVGRLKEKHADKSPRHYTIADNSE